MSYRGQCEARRRRNAERLAGCGESRWAEDHVRKGEIGYARIRPVVRKRAVRSERRLQILAMVEWLRHRIHDGVEALLQRPPRVDDAEPMFAKKEVRAGQLVTHDDVLDIHQVRREVAAALRMPVESVFPDLSTMSGDELDAYGLLLGFKRGAFAHLGSGR